MSARHQTFSVLRSNDGWLVQLAGRRDQIGPYPDKESAIAKALVAVRQTRPSKLKISNAPGVWRADCTYRDDRPSA
jgi:hypothetical protein